jgi:hypothetical protein
MKSLALFFSALVCGGLSMRANAERVFTASGQPVDDAYFPVAVWLQSPRNAPRFKEAGINLYVGLWQGPTEDQLAGLTKAGMPVICDQNTIGLAHRDNPIIAGWMHGDEPDNAQPLPGGRGYGPPILPDVIVEHYRKLRQTDPTRPVLLNLGQGVAYDNYIDRGVRRNRMEDYPQYVHGCDIASFDIYPVAHDSPEVAGKLEFVGLGVQRLVEWTDGKKPVWSCIECTRIDGRGGKATPSQVRSEVWIALIRGARGLIYFVHQFKPDFQEAALLNDPEMLAGVTAINREIKELAPVLNSPSLADVVKVTNLDGSPVAAVVKRHEGTTYLFAVNLTPQPATATFTVTRGGVKSAVEIGGTRTIPLQDDAFIEPFQPYAVHRYRLLP